MNILLNRSIEHVAIPRWRVKSRTLCAEVSNSFATKSLNSYFPDVFETALNQHWFIAFGLPATFKA